MLYRLTTAQRGLLILSFVIQSSGASPVFARSEVEGGRGGSLFDS